MDVDEDGETDVTGENATVRFHELGNRTVELAVTDDAGNVATDNVSLFVNDRPRTVFEHTSDRPNPGEQVTFDATAAGDDRGRVARYQRRADRRRRVRPERHPRRDRRVRRLRIQRPRRRRVDR